MKIRKLLFVLVIALMVSIAGCSEQRPPTADPIDLGLNQVRDMQELKTLLAKNNDHYLKDFFGFLGGVRSNDNAVPEMNTAEDSGTNQSSTTHSRTNVQVEGVDEGDIIKTDGERIYSIKYDRLMVVGILGDGAMELLLSERLGSVETSNYRYTYFSDLYLTSRYLIVIGQSWQYTHFDATGGIMDDSKEDPDQKEGESSIESVSYYYSTPTTVVWIYELETLEKVEEHEVSGYYLSSRLIDDNLYLINNHYVYNYIQYPENYDPRPWTKSNGEMNIPEFTDIKYLPEMNYESFTIITTFMLDEEVTLQQNIFLGSSSWGQIYVSKQSIYLATTVYNYDLLRGYTQKGVLISYTMNEETGIVTFGGAADFLGYVINQFAMDEYNGFMRIVTTEGWGDAVKNRLYVFERQIIDNKLELKQVGFIGEGIGKPRETVRSVRFNGDKATIVTFEQTDPFYTVDLSDPTAPTIKGELEIPGFSLYQHIWDEDLVLGIGQEADLEGRVTGLKLSLYDISDFENPVEVGTPLVLLNTQNSWSFSEALYNHKAILIGKEKGFIGFSIWRDRWFWNYYTSNNDYIIFDVNPANEQPITIKHVVTHFDLYEKNSELYSQSDQYYYGYYNFSVERAVYIGDYLYVVSGEAITSHNLTGEFSTVQEMIFIKETSLE